MNRFEVVTDELGGVGVRVTSAAGELSAATSALERVSVAGPAADHPGVTAALGQLVAAWGPAVSAMQAGAETLGTRLFGAEQNYVEVDRGAMGAGGP
jgi:hypothetical protein